jgi:beta-lactamase superfamily II metal-dependent hydrolase
VFLLETGPYQLLSTGTRVNGQRRIMENGSSVDVLRVFLYGRRSATGDLWLDQVSPCHAVISATELLKRLQDHGARI